MCQNTLLEEPELLSPLFLRRSDIDTKTRLKIGFFLNYYPRHGLATDLSRRYQVSRTFVYNQRDLVKAAFTLLDKQVIEEQNRKREENVKWLLNYRIRGGVSISKCSDFLSLSNFDNTSSGWISERIKSAGDLVGDTFSGWKGEVVLASDEIYLLGGVCVLVSCDPVSSVIFSLRLCNKLSAKSWQMAWSSLQSEGIEPIGIVADEGSSLLSAHSQLESVAYQVDTFHAITQRFGKVLTRLENHSLRSIKHEYEREAVYLNAKSIEHQTKKEQAYHQSKIESERALTLLSDFKWLYRQITCQLKVVRSNGEIRLKQYALDQVQAALELMEETLELDLSKEIKAVRKLLPDLFQYLDKAAQVHSFLEKKIEDYILPFHLAYWQYKKDLVNLKKAADKNRLTKARKWLIQIMEEYKKHNPEQFERESKMVFAAMQTVIQSSAMVECINSILRPFFNESKGQVSQQSLNLIRYWHNHRVFKKGLRKGKSPVELLTGQKPEVEWNQGIIDLIKQNDASTVAA